jgi:hypothetical protein
MHVCGGLNDDLVPYLRSCAVQLAQHVNSCSADEPLDTLHSTKPKYCFVYGRLLTKSSGLFQTKPGVNIALNVI